jgi:hypothetical protein
VIAIAEFKYQTESIRNATDIVALIGEHVRLRKSGVQFVGLCPFHKEKTPSFYVHPSKGVYKCHGCGASGDVFTFIQQIEGVNFKGARALLAERAGVTVSDRRPTVAERRHFALLMDTSEWRVALVESLRSYRDQCFQIYHRALRFILIHDFDEEERCRPGRFGLVMAVADTYEARYQDLDRRIKVLTEASPDTLLPFFKAAGDKAGKALVEYRTNKEKRAWNVRRACNGSSC